MKPDEREFLVEVARLTTGYLGSGYCRPFVRDIINDRHHRGDMHAKRARYLLSKWLDKGWYDYGVTLDLGWLTDKGREAAANCR